MPEITPEFATVNNSLVIEAATRAEVDIQISTAKRYPMHSDAEGIARFQRQAMALATCTEETAESCFYSLRRDGKMIRGKSVRLAEIGCACYGNIRAAARIIEIGERELVAQGACHDLENNVSQSTEVRRRITTKDGKRYSDDMILVTANAACSIAYRNAVYKVVPEALFEPIYHAALSAATGKADVPIEVRRERAAQKFSLLGVPQERLLAEIGVKTLDALTVEHLSDLIGLYNAIKAGETSIDEAFPAASPAPTKADPRAFVPLSETAPVVKPKPAKKAKTDEHRRIDEEIAAEQGTLL